MDATDLRILAALVANGRITFTDLAERINLSGPSTAERVRKLEERGVVRGYSAILDPELMGRGLTAFVAVTIESPSFATAFLAGISRLSSVVECHHVAGEDDYLLKIHVNGTRGLEMFISDRLKVLPGVARTRTTVVLSTPLERPFSPEIRA
jgi:Lrp/AsnC family leucine-responsive transcriptional regulator